MRHNEPDPVYHDGTRMVLVPEVLFSRLEEDLWESLWHEKGTTS